MLFRSRWTRTSRRGTNTSRRIRNGQARRFGARNAWLLTSTKATTARTPPIGSSQREAAACPGMSTCSGRCRDVEPDDTVCALGQGRAPGVARPIRSLAGGRHLGRSDVVMGMVMMVAMMLLVMHRLCGGRRRRSCAVRGFGGLGERDRGNAGQQRRNDEGFGRGHEGSDSSGIRFAPNRESGPSECQACIYNGWFRSSLTPPPPHHIALTGP